MKSKDKVRDEWKKHQGIILMLSDFINEVDDRWQHGIGKYPAEWSRDMAIDIKRKLEAAGYEIRRKNDS